MSALGAVLRGPAPVAPPHVARPGRNLAVEQRDHLPLGDLIDTRFPLQAVDAALALAAAAERRALRPALVP